MEVVELAPVEPAAPAKEEPAVEPAMAAPAVLAEPAVPAVAEPAPAAAEPVPAAAELGPTAHPAAAAASAGAAAPSAGAAAAAPSSRPPSRPLSAVPSTATLPPLAVPPPLGHYPQEVLQIAALARTTLGIQRGQQANLRMVRRALR